MFIVFDGVDGGGKSTQIALTRQWLSNQGVAADTWADPGSTPLGLKLRELLLGKHELAIGGNAETLLFLAARAQLVQEHIRPALAQGRWVLCDRFTLSTEVYQGHAAGLDLEGIRQCNLFATAGVRPDLTFVFDLPVDVALARLAANSNRSLDRMESRGRDYLERVRQGFLMEAARFAAAVHVLDAQNSAADLQTEIQRQLAQFLVGQAPMDL